MNIIPWFLPHTKDEFERAVSDCCHNANVACAALIIEQDKLEMSVEYWSSRTYSTDREIWEHRIPRLLDSVKSLESSLEYDLWILRSAEERKAQFAEAEENYKRQKHSAEVARIDLYAELLRSESKLRVYENNLRKFERRVEDEDGSFVARKDVQEALVKRKRDVHERRVAMRRQMSSEREKWVKSAKEWFDSFAPVSSEAQEGK